MEFGKRLQKLRKERGLSQEELAARLGVSRQAVSKWELGESRPELENVVQLSECLEVTTDYLLKGTERRCGTPAGEKAGSRHTAGKFLRIAALALALTGLLYGGAGWLDEQTMKALAEGMIFQVAGLAVWLAADVLEPPPVRGGAAAVMAGLALCLPIPARLLTGAASYLIPFSYPSFLEDTAALVLYGILLIVCCRPVKRRYDI